MTEALLQQAHQLLRGRGLTTPERLELAWLEQPGGVATDETFPPIEGLLTNNLATHDRKTRRCKITALGRAVLFALTGGKKR